MQYQGFGGICPAMIVICMNRNVSLRRTKKTSQSLIHPAKHARKHCFHDCTSGELTNISFLGDHCRRWVSQAYPGGSC